MLRCLALFLTLSAPAVAEEFLGANEFAQHVDGRTIAYDFTNGRRAGIEHYLPGGKVLWVAKGDPACQEGYWEERSFPRGPAICFTYDDKDGSACWHVERIGAGLKVTLVHNPLGVLVENPLPATMPCSSPYLGS